jgi:flagellar P-ring protein precursor FlgI
LFLRKRGHSYIPYLPPIYYHDFSEIAIYENLARSMHIDRRIFDEGKRNMTHLTSILKKSRIDLLIVFALFFSIVAPMNSYGATAAARLKDIADIEGVRSNILVGYGLVVGLAGTGDAANSVPFTRQALINMLERLGVNAKAAEDSLKMKNVAAVMVTADMPSFSRQGSKIDVTVSSLGDSKSLEGGMLLATPLMAADGNTYAVAQGALVIGGFTAEGNAGTISKNHPTVARIASGGTVERETGHELANHDNIRLILRNPDFTTALRVEKALNKAFGENVSSATDNGTIDIALPERYKDVVVAAIQKIENVVVRPDIAAKVIVDEKTGTIVMGEDVRISDVAISHANLTIRVNELAQASQPLEFSETGETAVLDRTNIDVDEDAGQFKILTTGTTLSALVNGLNALGVKPRDIISILQNIKAAGALQADLKLM